MSQVLTLTVDKFYGNETFPSLTPSLLDDIQVSHQRRMSIDRQFIDVEAISCALARLIAM